MASKEKKMKRKRGKRMTAMLDIRGIAMDWKRKGCEEEEEKYDGGRGRQME